MKTQVTELFQIEHPIIQGGMHYVGFAELAAAVSNAGGLGIITGLTQRTPADLAKEISRCRDMTNKPFGVNLTFLPTVSAPDYPGYVEAIIEGGVKIVETAGRRVIGMVEKPVEPPSNLAIAGIYRVGSQRNLKQALAAVIESNIITKGEYQLTDALALMVEQGEEFLTFPIARWLDCGTEKTLLDTNSYLLEGSDGRFIHSDAIVERSTICSSSIMENCRVYGCTLEDCIILPGAQLESCTIRNEIVEENARLSGYRSSP